MTALIVDGDYVENGAALLVGRHDVENEQNMAAAVSAGADLMQGRYLAEPTPAIGTLSRSAREQANYPGCAW